MTAKRRCSRFLVLAGFIAAAIFLLSSQAAALRFVVYGDSRGNTETNIINTEVFSEINKIILTLQPQPEMVIFCGDSVRRGSEANFVTWLELTKPLTDRGIKLYLAIGNHELYKATGAYDEESGAVDLDNQKAFQKVFDFLPTSGPDDDHKHLAYTFTSADGDSLFAVLAAYYVDPQTLKEYSGDLDPIQLDWVKKELDKSTATHKFVFAHRPIYAWDGGEPPASLKELWQSMDQNRVDIYFSGHWHLYSRKTIDKKIDPSYLHDVVQVIDGSCGAPLSSPESGKGKLYRDWHVKFTYNFSVVDVKDGRVKVKSYGAHFWQKSSPIPVFSLIDSFTRKTPVSQTAYREGSKEVNSWPSFGWAVSRLSQALY